jgi:hypothetical protein
MNSIPTSSTSTTSTITGTLKIGCGGKCTPIKTPMSTSKNYSKNRIFQIIEKCKNVEE